MKTWKIPAAVEQRFAANDYVSACTASIKCDLELAEGFMDYYIYFGKVIPTRVGDLSQCVYTPCGKEHDVSAHGELLTITITDGRLEGKKKVALEEPINCYFWAEYDEAGVMQDGHCTLNRDGFQSNKS